MPGEPQEGVGKRQRMAHVLARAAGGAVWSCISGAAKGLWSLCGRSQHPACPLLWLGLWDAALSEPVLNEHQLYARPALRLPGGCSGLLGVLGKGC